MTDIEDRLLNIMQVRKRTNRYSKHYGVVNHLIYYRLINKVYKVTN